MDLKVRAFYSGLSTLLSKCKEDLQDLIQGFEVKFIQRNRPTYRLNNLDLKAMFRFRFYLSGPKYTFSHLNVLVIIEAQVASYCGDSCAQ